MKARFVHKKKGKKEKKLEKKKEKKKKEIKLGLTNIDDASKDNMASTSNPFESCIHLLQECSFAQVVWLHAPYWNSFRPVMHA